MPEAGHSRSAPGTWLFYSTSCKGTLLSLRGPCKLVILPWSCHGLPFHEPDEAGSGSCLCGTATMLGELAFGQAKLQREEPYTSALHSRAETSQDWCRACILFTAVLQGGRLVQVHDVKTLPFHAWNNKPRPRSPVTQGTFRPFTQI